jgi:hypothetical protein
VSISRADVLARARQGFGDGLGRTPYDQGAQKNGWRTDCSGYACRCWNQASGWGGESTVSLVDKHLVTQLPNADALLPGDAIGLMGPGTDGDNGHIVIFEQWVDDDPTDDRLWIFEQCGGTSGPIHRITNYPYDGNSSYTPWRYVGIADGVAHDVGEDMGAYQDGPWSGAFWGGGQRGWAIAGLLGQLSRQPEGRPLAGRHLDGSSVFDPVAVGAMAAFKKRIGAADGTDGTVGPGTWHALCGWWEGSYLTKGASGAAVAGLQRYLRMLGHDVEMNGTWGPRTDTAVAVYNPAKVLGPGTVLTIEAALRRR